MNNGVMFGMMLTLLRNEKVTKRYLAEKFEMSERTVIRYMDTLALAGVPIYSIRGKTAGMRFRPSISSTRLSLPNPRWQD